LNSMAENQNTLHQDEFVDLISYSKIKQEQYVMKGNLIKSSAVKSSGKCKIEVEEGDEHKPSVIIHRTGDIIDQVEFVCSCGKSTVLEFDYVGK
jgi:hypothetical protein